MLDNFRKISNSFVIRILLAGLIFSFVYWGISGFVNSSFDDYVASVDGDEYISTENFIKEKSKYIRELRSQAPNISNEQLRNLGYNQLILRDLIIKKLVEIEAKYLGIRISDDLVIQQIMKDDFFFNKDKKFDPNRFKAILASNKITEKEYADEIKNKMAAYVITHTFSLAPIVPEIFVSANFMASTQKRVATVIRSTPITNISISDKEIDIYYSENKNSFKSPEYRDIEIIYIEPQHVANSVKLDNNEIASHFNTLPKEHQNQSNKKKLEQQLKLEKIDQAILNIVQKVEKDLDSDINLEKIAANNNVGYKKYSKITQSNSSIPKYDNLAKQLFEAEEDTISDIHNIGNGKQGFYLFKVNKVYPSTFLEFNPSLKNTIKNALSKQKIDDLQRSTIAKVRNLIEHKQNYKGEKNIQSTTITIENNDFEKYNNIPNEAILELFALQKNGEISQLYKTTGGQYVILILDKIINNSNKLTDTNKSIISAALSRTFSQIQYQELLSFLHNKYKIKVNAGLLNKL